ncbi:MAG: lysophospholipid acyltransferase family protein [Alphaproteobacteria bacterium]
MHIPGQHHLQGWADVAAYRMLKRMPVPVASGVGAVLGCISGACFQRANNARAFANLARLKPDATVAERRVMVRSMWKHLGRIMTEYSCLGRLSVAGRIEVVGAETLPAPGTPLIVAASHIGSWDALCISLVMQGYKTASIYQPQPNKTRAAIALRERLAIGWIGLAADRAPARAALRHLHNGDALALFVDECVDGHVRAPRLGRSVELNGNILLAARLAHSTGAALSFARCERLSGARYRVSFIPIPIEGADVETTVHALDAALEIAVRAQPEQWLMSHVLTFKADDAS